MINKHPLVAVLNGLTFTSPYSLDDARELLAMIHQLAPGVIADVYSPRGTQVFVEIRLSAIGEAVRRTYDVV